MATKHYKLNCDIQAGMSLPEGMHRYALVLEYNGSVFQGFQKQSNTPKTVQAYLETALSAVADRPVVIACAGRTDAGVHATRQVIHFDIDVVRPPKAWIQGVNTKLPNDIRVHWASEVSEYFHSRFSAQARTYRYVLYSAPIRPAFVGGIVTWSKYRFDVERMTEASEYLLGELDFTSFRATQCQANSPVRTVEYIRFNQSGPYIVMEIKANAFLHHMVRNIAGSLIDVGRGAKPVEWIQGVLNKKDRRAASATASPDGLFLVGVDYPMEFTIPSQAQGPDFLAAMLSADPST